MSIEMQILLTALMFFAPIWVLMGQVDPDDLHMLLAGLMFVVWGVSGLTAMVSGLMIIWS